MASSLEIRALHSAYIPAPQAGARRLLVVLHGLGDSLEGYRFLPEILGIPGLHYLLVNAPDPHFSGFSWFDLYGDLETGVVRSRGLLHGLMEELEAQGWKPEHVGVFGFSQGCLMALDLACRYPKVLGAVVGVSGFIGFLDEYPEAFSPVAREQKIMITHGTEDPLLPYEVSHRQVETLQSLDLPIEWKVYAKEHTIEPRQEVKDIRDFLERNLVA